jgi:hypothetical protein
MERNGGVFDWAESHNCEFGVEKFQLLDATKKLIPNPLKPRRRIPQPRQALILREQRIPSKETARFLGVIVDNKLNWKAQCTAALAKGQDWLIQFGRLARASRGITAKYTRQLYLSIAIPRILYAADIFLTPLQNIGKRPKNGCRKQASITKLATIQRRAAIIITGAMKTTAADAVEVMANLLPFHLLVDKHRHRAAIRLATLPSPHPLHKPVANTASRLVKRHATPLHDLVHRYRIQPRRSETRWKAQFGTEVIPDTDKAIEAIRCDNPDVKVFTDGSGMDGKIGAAAVLYRAEGPKPSYDTSWDHKDTTRCTKGKA